MSTALELRNGAAPSRIGQATAVEQSRAIAQVQAMVIVAQQCPRSVSAAIRAMEEACAQPELAKKAFYRFERGKLPNGKPNVVTGPSVHLARELARCWGNIEHGVTELRRDDVAAESEMQAFAWDLETNTRSALIFIVPHKRDTKTGAKELTEMRDIYDNNANNGARRLREAIYSVLPVWFRERGQAICRSTNESGGGKPLAQRVADAVTAFERYRVSPARLAAKFGHASVDELTAADVADLGDVYESLRQGTVTVADEFPDETPGLVSPSDLAPPGPSPAAAGTAKPPPAGSPTPPADAQHEQAAGEAPARRASTGQVGLIQKQFERLGMGGDDQRDGCVRVTAAIAGRPLASSKELTPDEARKVRDTLEGLRDGTDLDGLLAELAMAGDPRDQDGDGE